MSKMPIFVYILKLAGREALEQMSPEKEAIVDEHFEYLKRALAEGKLILAGRCQDKEFGIVIFQAKSEEQAEKFMKNDPAVKKGVMTAELHPFKIALLHRT